MGDTDHMANDATSLSDFLQSSSKNVVSISNGISVPVNGYGKNNFFSSRVFLVQMPLWVLHF